jgi:hypothetical protein
VLAGGVSKTPLTGRWLRGGEYGGGGSGDAGMDVSPMMLEQPCSEISYIVVHATQEAGTDEYVEQPAMGPILADYMAGLSSLVFARPSNYTVRWRRWRNAV